MSDIEFIDGLSAKAPRQNAPDFVKASLSIKREALIAWLQQRDDEWVNADVKEARSGKWYVAVDPWRPNSDRQQRPERSAPHPAPAQAAAGTPAGEFDDDIPF